MSHLETGLWFIFLTMPITGLLVWAEEWASERLKRRMMKEVLAS
jgi:hypothetical protein